MLTVTCGTFEHDMKDIEMKKSRARVSPA